eukprot:gene10115-18777_t
MASKTKKVERFQQTVFFICTWEAEFSLWNVMSSMYKDRNEKLKSLKTLVEKCQMTVPSSVHLVSKLPGGEYVPDVSDLEEPTQGGFSDEKSADQDVTLEEKEESNWDTASVASHGSTKKSLPKNDITRKCSKKENEDDPEDIFDKHVADKKARHQEYVPCLTKISRELFLKAFHLYSEPKSSA